LDAAHGKSVGAAGSAQHVDAGRRKVLEARKTAVPCNGRGAECVAVRADFAQDSAQGAAVARSRRKIAIAQRNAAEREQVQFTIQNAKFTINRFSSRVRFHRCHSEAKPKNLLIGSIHSSCARPGRLRGSRLWARAGPGARSSVSEREQILRDMLAIIVILSVSEESMTNAASAETACRLCRARRRKTNEVQSNICIVSIQILRRYAPQNDKLLS